MCTPALPKPIPAKVAAIAMSIRASTSSPSRTAVRKDCASSDRAFSDHMSATGLAPQYGTRWSALLRAKEVYGLAV